jgi:hypothetical protein
MVKGAVKRVLAIDPFSRGVAFAVLEGPENLIDWGIRSTGKANNEKAARLIEKLIDRYHPDVLALENWEAAGARRCQRVDLLLNYIASHEEGRVRVQLVSRRQILAIGPLPHASTKHGRASLLAERFPELQAFLPPVRRIWEAENPRINVFDALAFAAACFPAKNGRST